MLGELGLISEEAKGTFAFRRGPKPTLSDGMFVYALIDYWEALDSNASSMAFETIVYGEGSPGRVFKLDEESVAERLFSLDDFTVGVFSWTDTSGLRQVLRKSWDSSAFRSWMLKQGLRMSAPKSNKIVRARSDPAPISTLHSLDVDFGRMDALDGYVMP